MLLPGPVREIAIVATFVTQCLFERPDVVAVPCEEVSLSIDSVLYFSSVYLCVETYSSVNVWGLSYMNRHKVIIATANPRCIRRRQLGWLVHEA